MAHTPGPWKAERTGYFKTGHIDGEPYYQVRSEYAASPLTDFIFEDDARLIAAAPDLLEACEKMVEYRDRASALYFNVEEADTFIHVMRAAIQKAREG